MAAALTAPGVRLVLGCTLIVELEELNLDLVMLPLVLTKFVVDFDLVARVFVSNIGSLNAAAAAVLVLERMESSGCNT